MAVACSSTGGGCASRRKEWRQGTRRSWGCGLAAATAAVGWHRHAFTRLATRRPRGLPARACTSRATTGGPPQQNELLGRVLGATNRNTATRFPSEKSVGLLSSETRRDPGVP